MQQKDYIVPLCKIILFSEENIRTSGDLLLPTGDREVGWSPEWSDRWTNEA